MFLNPHLGTIIWITIIFSILYFILAKFAWKPLLKALNERERTVADSLRAAEEAELQIAAIKSTQLEAIEVARLKKENLIHEGNVQAEKIIAAAKAKAHIDAEKIISDARKRIELEREASVTEMKNLITALSLEIVTKVVHSDMGDKKRHEMLIGELVNEVDLN